MGRITNIDEILNLLDEKTISEKIKKPHIIARGLYQMKKHVADDYDDFLEQVKSYYIFHYRKAVAESLPPEEIIFGNISEILKKNYGSISSAAKTGQNFEKGGLFEIFNLIKEAFIKEHGKKYVDFIIDNYINPQDTEQIATLMKQLIETSPDFLDEEVHYNKLAYMVTNYRHYLELYVHHSGKMKQAFRNI